MIAKRTKHLKLGLLPRMEARPRAKGGWTFRYYTYDRKYINLGHDRAEAIKRVLEMERRAPDTGTVGELIREYMASGGFKNDLAPKTQDDIHHRQQAGSGAICRHAGRRREAAAHCAVSAR